MRPRPPLRALVPAVFLAALLAGCAGLRIPAPPPVEADDWPTAARGAGRTGMTPERIRPPLTEAWSADVTGGTGGSALAVVDSILYVTTLRGDLLAFHARTGRGMGRVSLAATLTGAPALSGTRAFVPASGGPAGLIAYDLADGSPAWRWTPGDVEAAPLLLRDRVILGTTAGTVVCLRAEGGEQIWTHRTPGAAALKGIRGPLASDSTAVFFGSDDGSLTALRTDNGSLLWRREAGGPLFAGPVLADTLVVAGTVAGRVVALGGRSGRAAWTADAGAAIYAPAAAADGIVIIGTAGGGLLALRIADGTRLWRADAGDAIGAAPVIAGDVVYAGTLGRQLLALSLASGEVLWRTELGGRLRAQPAAARGMLFVITDERVLTAFREEEPR